MTKDQDSWKIGRKLEQTIDGKRGELLRSALLDWNRPFAPTEYTNPRMSYRSSFSNSVLFRRLLDPLHGGPQNFPDADELWKWVEANIELPKELTKSIQDERKSLKAKHRA